VGRRVGGTHVLDRAAQPRQVEGRAVLGGTARRDALQRDPDLVDLQHLLGLVARTVSAVVAFEPVVLEAAQRFPHRGPAGAVPGRQVQLDQRSSLASSSLRMSSRSRS